MRSPQMHFNPGCYPARQRHPRQPSGCDRATRASVPRSALSRPYPTAVRACRISPPVPCFLASAISTVKGSSNPVPGSGSTFLGLWNVYQIGYYFLGQFPEREAEGHCTRRNPSHMP